MVSLAQNLTHRVTDRRIAVPGTPPWVARWLAVAPVVLLAPVLALLVYWNFAGLLYTIGALPRAGSIGDWFYWGWVNPANPYGFEWVRWSPPAVAVMAFLHPWALWPVIIAHLVALAFLRDWRVIAVVLLSWPFWEDALNGGVTTFAFVAGWTALEGSSAGVAVFVLLAMLVPRPLMLPMLGWLAWHRPVARWFIALGAFGVVVVSLAMNQLGPWVHRLLEIGTPPTFNLAPSALIGGWWVVLGLPIAAWLTVRGRLGLASLAASPYIHLYYLVFGLFELQVQADRSMLSRATGFIDRAWPSRRLSPSVTYGSQAYRLALGMLIGVALLSMLGVLTGAAQRFVMDIGHQSWVAIAYAAAAFTLIPGLAWVLEHEWDWPQSLNQAVPVRDGRAKSRSSVRG